MTRANPSQCPHYTHIVGCNLLTPMREPITARKLSQTSQVVVHYVGNKRTLTLICSSHYPSHWHCFNISCMTSGHLRLTEHVSKHPSKGRLNNWLQNCRSKFIKLRRTQAMGKKGFISCLNLNRKKIQILRKTLFLDLVYFLLFNGIALLFRIQCCVRSIRHTAGVKVLLKQIVV